MTLQDQPLTVMLWLNLDPNDSSLQNGEKFLFGTATFGLRILKGQYYWGVLNRNAGAAINIPTGDPGTWVHLCGQYDYSRSQWSLYRNTYLMATTTGVNTIESQPIWYLGGRPNLAASTQGIQFKGVGLFAANLAVADLQTIYLPLSNPTPPSRPSDNLIAYWPLSDGTGTTIADSSGVSPEAPGTWTDSSIIWGTTSWVSNMIFVNAGQDLNTQIQQISDSGADKPYQLYLDVASFRRPVILKSGLTLIGSGQYLTRINVVAGSVAPFGALVLADQVEVRQLDIQSTAASNDCSVCGLEAPSGAIVAQIKDVVVLCQGSNFSVTVKSASIMEAGLDSQVSFLRCYLNTQGGVADTVVVNQSAQLKFEQCEIESLSGANAASVGLVSSYGPVTLQDSQIVSPNIGLYAQTGSQVNLQNCQIQGSKGALITAGNGQIVAQQCQITGRVQGNVTIDRL